jgi:hypothetical protein
MPIVDPMDQADFPWRPLGLLLVGKGLVTDAELDRSLNEQRRSGRLLGQILVANGHVTSLALTQALAEQHGVELRSAESHEAPEQRSTSSVLELPDRTWRPLGKILVAKQFLNEHELEHALAEQKTYPDRRLGEILVAHGWLSGPALALGLAEQHGVDIGAEAKLDAELQTVVTPTKPGQPVYRVFEVEYEPFYRPGAIVWETTNFLDAADFACEFVERQSPKGLEIQKTDGRSSETVWTYSETRAAVESATRKNLVQTFGYDPMRWDTSGSFDTPTK